MTSSSSTNESSETVPPGSAPRAAREGGARSRRRRRRTRLVGLAAPVGIYLTAAVLVAAPLAIGGVHRVPMILLMLVSATGLACFALGSAADHRPLRIGVGVLAPLVLLAVPALQSLPLPLALRGLLDPNGNALLLDNGLLSVSHWPLSLDPPITRERIGEAAAAVAMFLVTYHLASGKSRRHLIIRLVALTGVAAVAVGLGHRVFGIEDIYGLVKTTARSLLTGPFVNRNHTAEFLELAAFACLACSYQRNTALNRYGWLTGTCVCAAGALGTISRGAFVALFAGAAMFIFLRRLSRGDRAEPRRAVSIAWGLFIALLVLGIAGALGAGALAERFRPTAVSQDFRLHLWLDSLRVLKAHPLGIGRGAFERVYPAYRTFKSPLPTTFAFVENYPLQLLIDSGWILFGFLVVGAVVVIRALVTRRRGDEIEAALLAGLFAVSVHSIVDFGLETMGVLLPFMALLGTVMGRSRGSDAPTPPRKIALSVVAVSCGGLLFGAAALVHKSSDDFDKLIRYAGGLEQTRAVLRRAQEVHPTDYFYALAYARTEPLKPSADGKSPRLHTLNRALRLCPDCELVHVEIARSLWQLGRRRQALTEWRSAVELQPGLFSGVVQELWNRGAKPQQLASIASLDPPKMVDIADFLSGQSRIDDALIVLDQADAIGAPRVDSLLTRARLQLQSNKVDAAQTTLAELRATGLQDPRVSVLEADLILELKGAAGVDEAFAVLDLAATRYPLDLTVQRRRLDLVSRYSKWQAADRAMEGFKRALYTVTGSTLEATIISARTHSSMSQLRSALVEYRTALAQSPNDAALWMEYGGLAERVGRDSTARDAYSEAMRITPSDPAVGDAIRRLDARRQNRLNNAAIGQGTDGDLNVP